MAAIGKLRKRITIYDRTDAEAGAYSASTTRTNPRTVWCKVDNVSGTQQIDSRNAGTGVSHRMTIRHRSDITMRQQILYGGKFYDIKTVQMMDEDRKQFMVLECLQSDTHGVLNDECSPEPYQNAVDSGGNLMFDSEGNQILTT